MKPKLARWLATCKTRTPDSENLRQWTENKLPLESASRPSQLPHQMRVHVGFLLLVAGLANADLPSCERARCIHCEVEFIASMCPTACAACPKAGTVASHPRPAQPPAITQLTRNVPTSVNKHIVQATPRVVHQPTAPINIPQQAQPAIHVQPKPQVFGARQAQVPVIPQPMDTSTLAPLIAQPRPDTLNPQLSRQPADLENALPEYQIYTGNANQYNNQLPQLPLGQNLFGQNNQFGLPQVGQAGSAQQQATPFVNPFQPFLQQTFQAGRASALDPLGLFNFGSAHPHPFSQTFHNQHQPLLQHNAFAQHNTQSSDTNYNGNYQNVNGNNVNVQRPPVNYNQNQIQNDQHPVPQLPRIQIPVMPHVPTNPAAQHVQPSRNQHPVYQTSSQAQVAPANQNTRPQQPQTVNNQYVNNNMHQPSSQQQWNNHSRSIDAAPVHINKYANSKTPLAPPPKQVEQTCPQQPGWAPCISKQLANERFQNCCARLGEGCAPLCNYDATLATMQLAVLTGRCPLAKVGDMMICASGYQDATPCCEAYNVFEAGYEHCRPYCNPSAGIPSGGLLSEKYKCLVKLSQIQQCFYVTQKP